MRSRKTDIQKDTLIIRERKRVRGKESTRRVPISSTLKQVLSEWLENHPGGPYTFCLDRVPHSRRKASRTGPQPISRDEANDHFKRTLKESKWEVIRGWHCLRHSFCSNCACKGIDQRIIDEWAGHSSDAMSRRYRHLFPHTQRAAINAVFD